MPLFGGSKLDHPMADIKQAKTIIADLPPNDAIKALDEITFWLDSISRADGFKVDYSYELYGLLDRVGKVHQRKLSQEYLTTDRQEKFRENKLWTASFDFWKTLGNAYSQCLEQFQAGARGARAVKKLIPAISCRVLRALSLQLKWVMLRYGPIADRVWGDLGQVFFFAENRGIAGEEVEVYPGLHGQSSVQQEFLKALMLGISSTDGLTPVRQEIAERLVAHFGKMYIMQKRPAAGCNYCFDLAMRKPAMRALKRVEVTPTMRYFGAGNALPALRQVMEKTKADGCLPADINLGGAYDTDIVLSVMRHLAMYWSEDPPARHSERRKTATRLTVIHGFQDMLKWLDPVQDAESLDFNVQNAGTESWIVENVSDGGYGAIIPQVKGDWIKIGSLLGVQAERSRFWGAGIVRRITRDEYQQRRVGIQVFSTAIIPVRVAPAGEVSSINVTRDSEAAVLLSTSPDKKGEIAMLLTPGTYVASQTLEMIVRGKSYILIPSRLNESGEDFDWASFKIMQRQ